MGRGRRARGESEKTHMLRSPIGTYEIWTAGHLTDRGNMGINALRMRVVTCGTSIRVHHPFPSTSTHVSGGGRRYPMARSTDLATGARSTTWMGILRTNVLWVILILQGRRTGSTHSRRRLALVPHGVRHNIRRDRDASVNAFIEGFDYSDVSIMSITDIVHLVHAPEMGHG